MRLTIFSASCVGNATNTIYPNKAVITNKDNMISVIARDHVCAEFKKAHRSIDDFISSDVEVMDCDNDHSDNPKDWITPEKYEELFPDVSYIIVPSRNDGKVKGNKSARPRHHMRWSSIFVTFTLKKIIDWNISFQTVSCIHLMNVDVYDCNSHIHNPTCFHLTLDLSQTDSVV